MIADRLDTHSGDYYKSRFIYRWIIIVDCDFSHTLERCDHVLFGKVPIWDSYSEKWNRYLFDLFCCKITDA